MRLILLTVLVALVAGFLTGGTLRDFPTITTRWWWLALVGVAMQFVTGGGVLETVLLLGSFVVLLAFVMANLRAPGFALVLLGLLLNAVVITANQGMPVTKEALVASGQANTLEELASDGDGQKHLLAGDDTLLLALGDVIAIGRRREPAPTLEPGTAEV